eukprot:Selendium_serpulae@DN6443_c2_g1_i18.p1
MVILARLCQDTITLTGGDCASTSSADEILTPPLFLYYELNNFYQNHRGYVLSRSDDQLRGVVFTNASQVSSCSPIITSPDDPTKILSPCGLIAWTVFTDQYNLTDDTGQPIAMDESAETIAWETDVAYKFKNPDPSDPGIPYIDEWLSEDIFPGRVENGHFMVWMRNAALPDFRKLYARIDKAVVLPVTVNITNRYFLESANAKKFVVLSQTNWAGGRNSFLGIAYTIVGAVSLILGIFFFAKNKHKPRILGDVRYLNWVGNNKRRK